MGRLGGWRVHLALVAAVVAIVLVAGCQGPRTSRYPLTRRGPSAPPAAAAAPAKAAPAGDVVYRLDLSTGGKADLYTMRGIASSEVKSGELVISASTDDPNFELFQARRAPGLPPALWLKVEMSNSVPGTWGEVYWDTGQGYNEKEAATWKLPGDRQLHEYVIRIVTDKPVLNFRFDPSARKDTVTIRKLEVVRAS